MASWKSQRRKQLENDLERELRADLELDGPLETNDETRAIAAAFVGSGPIRIIGRGGSHLLRV